MKTGGAIRKITVLRAESVTGRTGAKKSEWRNLFGDGSYLYARVSYKNQSMARKSGNFVLTSELAFVIRYYKEINEYMRICWEGRKYRINSIRRYPESDEMQIYADLIDE